jgi:5-methylcytosine-specific restriction endonuclease McrA
MIPVTRGEPPENFAVRARDWNERFATAREADAELTPSKFWSRVRPELRADAAVLAERFHDKCAYCESTLPHVAHPHIEHYRPKGNPRFEHQMFEWSNWLLSCGVCNDKKWTNFPEQDGEPLLLDPSEHDPSPHIGFRRSFIFGISDKGLKTVELVKLERRALERERARWLLTIDNLLLSAVQSRSIQVRDSMNRKMKR